MADEAQLSPFVFACQGGLVLDQSTFAMQPGMALELQNFEPDISGGYRRISGYAKWNSNIVPQTAASTEPVLMVALFNSKVIAARGTKIFEAGTTGSWSEIDTGRTSAGRYTFFRYNLAGTDFIIWADGANHATKYDGTTLTDINASGAPANPKFVTGFKDHLFFAGASSTPQQLTFTAPFTDNDFNSSNGAGTIKVDSNITGLFPFRDALFIFCEERIFKLTGTGISTFVVQPVTREIGCLNGFTIQEFAGDIVFLGPDGLRTVAGTERIGDVELGTISSNVQSIFDDNLSSASEFESVVIPDRTQYRIFFTKANTAQNSTKGVATVLKGRAFEFSELRGIKPASTDSFVTAGNVVILHGDYSNGYVYRQEQGNTFDGTAILAKYRSPDMTFGDAGIRKHMHRVIVNFAPESTIDADLFLRYDYESADSSRPAAYALDSSDIAAVYGTTTYGVSSTTVGTYGGASQPLVRQAVEGSGFAVALRVNDGGETAPYSLKGFQLEYQTGARR